MSRDARHYSNLHDQMENMNISAQQPSMGAGNQGHGYSTGTSRSQQTSTKSGSSPWKHGAWDYAAKKASQASVNGGVPTGSYPVYLDPRSPISSAEQLQKWLRLPHPPQVTSAPRYDMTGAEVGRVNICHVGHAQRQWIEDNAVLYQTSTDDYYMKVQSGTRKLFPLWIYATQKPKGH